MICPEMPMHLYHRDAQHTRFSGSFLVKRGSCANFSTFLLQQYANTVRRTPFRVEEDFFAYPSRHTHVIRRCRCIYIKEMSNILDFWREDGKSKFYSLSTGGRPQFVWRGIWKLTVLSMRLLGCNHRIEYIWKTFFSRTFQDIAK